jgi:hypothetical protein
MAIKTFFTDKTDSTLKKKVIPGVGDWYIQELVYQGTGVYANTTTGTSTLTPATSPAWTVNDFASTVAKNLIIYDANNKAASALIVSNTAAAITFDETACLLDEDETTAATLTPGATYSFYALTPSSVSGQIYGPYLGYAEAVDIQITDDIMKFKNGFPLRLQFSDVRERTGTIAGGHLNNVNKDIAMAILGGISYGLNSGTNSSFAVGTSPTRGTYRLAIDSIDRGGKHNWTVIRQVQFSANGSLFGDAASGHKMINFNGDILADAFYPVGADMVYTKRLA